MSEDREVAFFGMLAVSQACTDEEYEDILSKARDEDGESPEEFKEWAREIRRQSRARAH